MKITSKLLSGICLGVAIFSSAARADEAGSIQVITPKNGGVIQAGVPTKLSYNVKPSSQGRHLQIEIDGQKPDADFKVEGCPCDISLPALPAGKHVIQLKEVKSDHSLTGVSASITVSAE